MFYWAFGRGVGSGLRVLRALYRWGFHGCAQDVVGRGNGTGERVGWRMNGLGVVYSSGTNIRKFTPILFPSDLLFGQVGDEQLDGSDGACFPWEIVHERIFGQRNR